jgi:sarcosine oxidase
MGGSALWHLAERGVRVVGVEQFEPGHAHGSSHGHSRIIRTAYAEGARYVPLARRAWELWAALERRTGARLVERTGGLMMAPAGSVPALAPVVSAEAHDLRYDLISADRLGERYPQHRVDPDTISFVERDAGVVRAEASVLAAISAARAAGARVRTGTRVVEIVPDRDRPLVRLADEEIEASQVVVAAGAWLTRLLPAAARPINVVRRVFAWFEADDPGDYGPDRFPVFIRTDASGEHCWYGVPDLDGMGVKIGVHVWPGLDEPVDPEEGARPPDGRDADLAAGLVTTALPGLRPRPVRMRPCLYSLTPDGDFLVGQRPDLPGLTLLGGFSGHGFKFAPVLGEIAADLALTGATRWEIDFLAPDRFDQRARTPAVTC